jgi:DNA-binding NarL/FixJ family response regulator
MASLNVRVFVLHPVAAAQYARVLAREADLQIASDGAPFDVGVFDGELPYLEGALRTVSLRFPSSRPVLLSEHGDEETCVRWLLHGVWGLIAYDHYEQELPEAVRSVGAGRLWFPPSAVVRWMQIERHKHPLDSPAPLTAREREVLDLLARALSNKEIATILRVTERTAKFHVHNLLTKLHVHSRRQLTGLSVADRFA